MFISQTNCSHDFIPCYTAHPLISILPLLTQITLNADISQSFRILFGMIPVIMRYSFLALINMVFAKKKFVLKKCICASKRFSHHRLNIFPPNIKKTPLDFMLVGGYEMRGTDVYKVRHIGRFTTTRITTSAVWTVEQMSMMGTGVLD